jgi:hypothetical protein
VAEFAVGDVVVSRSYQCRGLVTEIDEAGEALGGRYVISVPGSPVAFRAEDEDLVLDHHGTQHERHLAMTTDAEPPPFPVPHG